MERAEKILADLVRLNIEERMAKLDNRQVELVAAAIEGLLHRLGLDPDQPVVADAIAETLHGLGRVWPARVGVPR